MTEEEKKVEEYLKNTPPCNYHITRKAYLDGLADGRKELEQCKQDLQIAIDANKKWLQRDTQLEEQIEKMKCCGNCKHNQNKLEDNEVCWNCERQCSKLGEEVIKDEWELAE